MVYSCVCWDGTHATSGTMLVASCFGSSTGPSKTIHRARLGWQFKVDAPTMCHRSAHYEAFN
eukprot:3211127-Amphidinium_carterae.1